LLENFTKEEYITFWKSYASRSRSGNFSSDSSKLRGRVFSVIWLISLEKSWYLYGNFIVDKEGESPLNFGSYPIRTSDPDHIGLGGGLQSLSVYFVFSLSLVTTTNKPVALLGGGGGSPRVTPSRRVTPVPAQA